MRNSKMMKYIFILVVALFLIVGCQPKQEIQTTTDVEEDVNVSGVEQGLDDLEDLEQDLNFSEIEQLEQELENISLE